MTNFMKYQSFVLHKVKSSNNSISNNSIWYKSLVCTQFKRSNCSIWPIDRALPGAIIPRLSGSRRYGCEGVLRILQSSSITEVSPSGCLVLYSGLWWVAVGVFYSPWIFHKRIKLIITYINIKRCSQLFPECTKIFGDEVYICMKYFPISQKTNKIPTVLYDMVTL